MKTIKVEITIEVNGKESVPSDIPDPSKIEIAEYTRKFNWFWGDWDLFDENGNKLELF